MIGAFFRRIFGNFQSREEVRKYALLGLIFGTLIATYWALRPLKDGIFMSIVGQEYQPFAKILSLFVVLVLIMVYSKLVDTFSRQKVFYILTGFYALGAFLFYLALSNPSIGIPNTVTSPTRIVGWLWYLFVESSGTLLVPLFWAFATDVSTADSAKRGFPLIVLCAQFGNFVGPFFLLISRRLGLTAGAAGSAPIVAILSGMFLLLGSLVWFFMRVTPKSEFHGQEEKKDPKGKGKKPGFFEGLRLILTQGYLFGIFVFLLAYEAVATIVDFYLKVQVKTNFALEADRTAFMAMFGLAIGLVSFFSILFGISKIQRKLGMRASLITTPILMMGGVLCWVFLPKFGFSGLWVAFVVVVVFKGINYALNQPSIKQLYIPTSKEARYKAQAWIEAFGSRGSKALGSGINATKLPLQSVLGPAAGSAMFMVIASAASFGLLGVWILVAIYVAGKYNKAVTEDKVIC